MVGCVTSLIRVHHHVRFPSRMSRSPICCRNHKPTDKHRHRLVIRRDGYARYRRQIADRGEANRSGNSHRQHRGGRRGCQRNIICAYCEGSHSCVTVRAKVEKFGVSSERPIPIFAKGFLGDITGHPHRNYMFPRYSSGNSLAEGFVADPLFTHASLGVSMVTRPVHPQALHAARNTPGDSGISST